MSKLDLKAFGGVVFADSCETLSFAAAELLRGLRKLSGLALNGNTGSRIRLEADSEAEDSFEIAWAGSDVLILGSNPRSVLFGVYTLLEKNGVRFFHLGEENYPEPKETIEIPVMESKAAFKVRGFMLEHGDSCEVGSLLIDFIAKNRGNSVYVHFTDIEITGDTLIKEAKKRGMEFTVGGHSCTRFLNDGGTAANQQYGERFQLCYNDPAVIKELCENIAAYLKANPGIDRLSLWPSDSKFDCECPECAKSAFNFRYVRFMEQLQEYLTAHNIPTQVEHIAYNAGLHEGMMDLPDFAPGESEGTDTLFAYWGRDYREGFGEVSRDCDKAGRECIEKWTKYRTGQPGREFRMLEYYNDFWMQTTVFPFLAPVIARDTEWFLKTGVTGVLSLIVPGRKTEMSGTDYPWEWIMGVNSCAMCQALWDGSLDPKAFADDYINNYCDGNPAAREIYNLIETALPELTRFNVPLFRLRFTDIWIRDNDKAEFAPDPWTPDTPQTAEEKRRDLFCIMTAGKFSEVAARLEYLPELTGNGKKLEKYFRFLHHMFNALVQQLNAQALLRK